MSVQLASCHSVIEKSPWIFSFSLIFSLAYGTTEFALHTKPLNKQYLPVLINSPFFSIYNDSKETGTQKVKVEIISFSFIALRTCLNNQAFSKATSVLMQQRFCSCWIWRAHFCAAVCSTHFSPTTTINPKQRLVLQNYKIKAPRQTWFEAWNQVQAELSEGESWLNTAPNVSTGLSHQGDGKAAEMSLHLCVFTDSGFSQGRKSQACNKRQLTWPVLHKQS